MTSSWPGSHTGASQWQLVAPAGPSAAPPRPDSARTGTSRLALARRRARPAQRPESGCVGLHLSVRAAVPHACSPQHGLIVTRSTWTIGAAESGGSGTVRVLTG